MLPASQSSTRPSPTGVRKLLATLWPAPLAGDSDLLRRKKFVVGGGQLAMALLVAVAVAGTAATHIHQLSPLRLIGLAVAGLAYIVWSLYGTHDAVRFVLWNHQLRPSPSWPARGASRSAIHVAVQVGIAESIIWLAGPAGIMGLLWLVLLPPIGYVIMFHGPAAIALTSVLTIALHTFNIVCWHGWGPVPLALPGFSVAVLFTLVFTQIAVSAERARGEVERLAQELRDANEKLRENAMQAGELAATRERNRMAREIHDSLGHCLTVVHVQLEAARATLDHDRDHAMDALAKAQSMTHSGLQEIRRSVSSLRTSPLHDRPIADALQQLVTESRVVGLVTELTVLGEVRHVSPLVAVTLYRAGQEGLTNSRKHARATLVRLLLDFRETGAVRLTVSDDGAGAGHVLDGFGLLGLRERAQLLGGEARVRTSLGEGFVLEVEVPA
jgi:signal transduction histidine kinase